MAKAFTSDLTGQEFWLVIDKGYQPLGMVLGNCVYSMGMVGGFLGNLKGNLMQGEVEQYSRLMYDARELAIRRMQAEADALGADGVIGVDLTINYMHNDSDLSGRFTQAFPVALDTEVADIFESQFDLLLRIATRNEHETLPQLAH